MQLTFCVWLVWTGHGSLSTDMKCIVAFGSPQSVQFVTIGTSTGLDAGMRSAVTTLAPPAVSSSSPAIKAKTVEEDNNEEDIFVRRQTVIMIILYGRTQL